jgi:polysaccharide biosynthesis transport protein
MANSPNQPPPPLTTNAIDRINFSIQLEKYRDMIGKRWWLIFLGISLGLAYGGYKAYILTDIYQAKGKMMVSPRISNPVGEVVGEEASNFYGTQVELMRSRQVIDAARNNPEVAKIEKSLLIPPSPNSSVIQLKNTSIFELRVISTSPEYSVSFLNAMMDEFIAYKKQIQEETTDVASATLLKEMDRKEKDREKAEAALFEFEKENNMEYFEGQGNMAAKYLLDLRRRLAEARTEFELLETETAEQRLDRTSLSSDSRSSSENGSFSSDVKEPFVKNLGIRSDHTSIKNAIALLKGERQDLAKYLRPKHPKIVKINEEIERKERLLRLTVEQTKEQIAAYRESLLKQQEAFQKSIAEWEKQAAEASGKSAKYGQLNADVVRSKDLYNVLSKRFNEIDIGKNIKQELISISERATSASLEGPSRKRFVVLNGILGLLISLGLVWLLDRFDDRIKTIEELQSLVQEPVLGQIPLIYGHGKHSTPLLMVDLPDQSNFAESFRHVRSSLMFSPTGGRAKSIVVTSAIPGDGKTTCSVNLALCLAQIEGARTLLIDGDMRKMNVHKFFKMENGAGLSEVLSGQSPLSNCIVSTGIPNLDLLRAGSVPPNPGELLLSENLKSLLTELNNTYNRIVIDTPPVMSTDDTLSLAPNVDGVIFIVKANQTSFRFVEKCMTSLKQRGARLFGLVLNHIDTSSAHYYYYNYYSGYYHDSSNQNPGMRVASRRNEPAKKLA